MNRDNITFGALGLLRANWRTTEVRNIRLQNSNNKDLSEDWKEPN